MIEISGDALEKNFQIHYNAEIHCWRDGGDYEKQYQYDLKA